MPWNWRKKRAAPAAVAITVDEHPTTSGRHFEHNQQQLQLQNVANTSISTETTSAQIGSHTSNIANSSDDNIYEVTNTVVRRLTPVLFSTNCGLYLRTAKPLPMPLTAASMGVSTRSRTTNDNIRNSSGACAYDLRFCDLERWSTNRANTVSLEDTFTVRPRNCSITSPILTAIDSSDSSCGAATGVGVHTGNNCFPIRGRNSFPCPISRYNNQNPRRSMSLRNTFERFDI